MANLKKLPKDAPLLTRIIYFLERVKERPRMYIGKFDVDRMLCFIDGFDRGSYLAMDEKNAAKHYRLMEEVSAERGWRYGPYVITVYMKEKGLSDEEAIQELLTIHIEAWRRMESL